jgi:nitroreductase
MAMQSVAEQNSQALVPGPTGGSAVGSPATRPSSALNGVFGFGLAVVQIAFQGERGAYSEASAIEMFALAAARGGLQAGWPSPELQCALGSLAKRLVAFGLHGCVSHRLFFF